MGHLKVWNLTARPMPSNGSKNMVPTGGLGFKTKRDKWCFQRDSNPLKINKKSACIACKCQYLNPDAASGAWQT